MKKITLLIALFIAFSTVLKAQTFSFLGLSEGSVNTSLGDITLTCTHYIEVNAGSDPAKIINLDNGNEYTLEYMSVGAVGNSKMCCFNLPGWATITEHGTYMLQIPTGFFTITTDEGEVASEEIVLSPLYIGKMEPLAFKEATPADGSTVQILDEIVLTFNRGISNPNKMNFPNPLAIVNEAGDTISEVVEWFPESASEQKNATILVENRITEAGTYFLTVPEGYFPDSKTGAEKHAAFTLSFIVDGTYVEVDTAIEGVDAELGESVVYDMLGRRVKEITVSGIYIVNGKKVLVK